MSQPDETSAVAESQHHHYTGSQIPWFVRLIWIGFWVFAIYYTIQYLFPNMQDELFR